MLDLVVARTASAPHVQEPLLQGTPTTPSTSKLEQPSLPAPSPEVKRDDDSVLFLEIQVHTLGKKEGGYPILGTFYGLRY